MSLLVSFAFASLLSIATVYPRWIDFEDGCGVTLHVGYSKASPGKAEMELALKAFILQNLRKIAHCLLHAKNTGR